jgi:hypothetical protein
MNLNRNEAIQRKLTEIATIFFFADSRWEILPPLLLAGSRYLGISQRLTYTLLAVPYSCPTLAKPWQFPSFFSKGAHFY